MSDISVGSRTLQISLSLSLSLSFSLSSLSENQIATSEAANGCSQKRRSQKFPKIQWKTPVESLFFNKATG